MAKAKLTKGLLTLVFTIVTAAVMFIVLGISASAASYPSVKIENMPRIGQDTGTPDCAIASIATVEAYFHDLPSGESNSKAYQAVYKAAGYSYSVNWSAVGYRTVESFDMQTCYDQLAMGVPVIVHRTTSHYSVVYGYVGSSSRLELSGFLLIEVDDWYTGRDSERQTLSEWVSGCSLDRMVLRKDGMAIAPSELKISGNHPAKYHIKGNTFTPYGMVLSNKKITSVSVTVKNSSDSNVCSYSASPNATSFALSNADSAMTFAKLGVGNYSYNITARDESGKTKSCKFNFCVVSSRSDIPNDGGFIDEPSKPVETPVSYKAVVKANPSLNMRKGPGTSYDIIASVPNKTIVSVSAECDGWAKISYSGKTGWVSKTYIQKYVEPVKPDVDDDDKETLNVVFGLVKSESSIKNSAGFFSTTVGSVPENAIVQILDKSSIWIKVSYKGKVGWVISISVVEGVGDIDANKIVNSSDALIALQIATGSVETTAIQRQLADVNGDGVVNSIDSLVILQMSVGIKESD